MDSKQNIKRPICYVSARMEILHWINTWFTLYGKIVKTLQN